MRHYTNTDNSIDFPQRVSKIVAFRGMMARWEKGLREAEDILTEIENEK